ncbi:lipopolysaccharide-induced tumor necrosis factor-alpha factor homolog [Trichogramma pretiosum]|uniref:lipopolysaccharide-induced tumor necrosis factor-alpha factor homolog n=1 Tax=Trichogramma pretiosum TaxID=7493 RepID=UPI000C71AD2C|nr:lipopolysaccharide-induced tumor necrosis factor-alpha factor homolog [Trichogramma pretiosum]
MPELAKNVAPIEKFCPYCEENVITDVEEVPKRLTCIILGLMCLFCCFCCIPGFMLVDGSREAQHRCPKCCELLGRVDLKGMTIRELRDEVRKEKLSSEKKKKQQQQEKKKKNKKKDSDNEAEEEVHE